MLLLILLYLVYSCLSKRVLALKHIFALYSMFSSCVPAR